MHTTIGTLLQDTHGISRMDAECLVAHALGVSREYIVAHSEETVSPDVADRIHTWYTQRKSGTPLAYLVGHKAFYGLDFLVNEHTLIPRPETELLVSLALDRLRSTDPRLRTGVIDVGTGSGCISIAIAHSLTSSADRDRVSPMFYATDISQKALDVAKQNAATHHADITFLHGNLIDPIPFEQMHVDQLIVCANLPYLTEEQFQQEPSIQQEPISALVAADHGLALYKELLQHIAHLSASSFSITCLFEIDPDQSASLIAYMRTHLPHASVTTHKDMAAHDRLIECRLTTDQRSS